MHIAAPENAPRTTRLANAAGVVPARCFRKLVHHEFENRKRCKDVRSHREAEKGQPAMPEIEPPNSRCPTNNRGCSKRAQSGNDTERKREARSSGSFMKTLYSRLLVSLYSC